MTATCLFCGTHFAPFRRGGHEKEFCSPECRATFHKAGRLWAVRAMKLGLLTVESLKAALQPTYTTPGSTPGVVDEAR